MSDSHITDADLARFEKYVEHTRTCWIWVGGASGGKSRYGAFVINGRQHKAHRVSYEAYVGPIPEGLHIDHLCRNTRCVNPSHLELVTNQVNALRGIGPTAENAKKTACKLGHPFDAKTYTSNGRRDCFICKQTRHTRYRARDRAARMAK